MCSIWKISSAVGLHRTFLMRSQKSNIYPVTQQPECFFFSPVRKDFICTRHLWNHSILCFFKIYFVIGGKLLYDVMLVSAIQQCGLSLALCDDPGGERCRRKLNRGAYVCNNDRVTFLDKHHLSGCLLLKLL